MWIFTWEIIGNKCHCIVGNVFINNLLNVKVSLNAMYKAVKITFDLDFTEENNYDCVKVK